MFSRLNAVDARTYVDMVPVVCCGVSRSQYRRRETRSSAWNNSAVCRIETTRPVDKYIFDFVSEEDVVHRDAFKRSSCLGGLLFGKTHSRFRRVTLDSAVGKKSRRSGCNVCKINRPRDISAQADKTLRNHITVSSAVATVASPTFLETLSTGLNNITTALLPRSALARAHQAFEHVLDYNRPAGAFGKPLRAAPLSRTLPSSSPSAPSSSSPCRGPPVSATSAASRLSRVRRSKQGARRSATRTSATSLLRICRDMAQMARRPTIRPPTKVLGRLAIRICCIGRGELTVGTVRHAAAKKAGVSDARRIKILYRGKNLKDDLRTCKAEGLRDGSELLLTIADVSSSASGSEDDDDDDDELADGAGQDGDGEGGRRRRNRGKKSKKKAKREASYQQNSEHLGVPPASSSQPSTRPQSPKPPTPATPIDKIRALRGTLESFLPQVQDFQRSPPEDQGKKEYEHKRLSETVLTQVLLKLDGVDTEGDQEARAKRKELVKDTQAVLHDIDAVMK
ncbi:hypothetical protein KC325_g153 [Hortaea werneckii]|nr:hypothetical protein KC325_g153 [Hortaea werneckii]